MSFYSNLESKIPDSVRTLGNLESIEEEEEIFPKTNSVSYPAINQIHAVKDAPKRALDKEKTLFFRSGIFSDSADHLGKHSIESNNDSGYKIAGIDGRLDTDDDSALYEEYSSSDVPPKPMIGRSDVVEYVTEKTDQLSISTPTDHREDEKEKKSKWSLFFQRAKTKSLKVKKNDTTRTFSVSQISKKKFFQKLIPRGKSFVAHINHKKSSKSEEINIKKSASEQAKATDTTIVISKSIKSETDRLQSEYRIVNQIGSGGHSVVNLAIRKADNKKVVAKTIQCVSVWHWHTDQRTGADDLPLEVYMLQKFDKQKCPGIIKYYDHFDLGTEFVIIMEYLGEDWMDLYDYIENYGPVPERDATEIFTRVVCLVCHLHNAGYCHNDIKDENIMINFKTREIKLIDFGSLTYLNTGVTHNTFYGTRKFQSPEAIKGTYLLEYQEVWALGTLYYVMLFKMDPFKNDDEVLQVDIKRRMERIRHFGVDGMLINISDEAVLSISNMLDRDWTKRPNVSEILSLPAFK